jgi:hypothetical protein
MEKNKENKNKNIKSRGNLLKKIYSLREIKQQRE